MFRNMIPGSCMESLSESGQAGIRIRDSILPDLELLLASGLESAISAALAGAGTTGILTGVTEVSFITTTPTYPTVGCSSIATTSITPADFMAEVHSKAGVRAEGQVEVRRSTSPDRSMGSQHLMPHLLPILVRSVALTTGERPEGSPLAGSRASVEAFMAEAVSMVAEASTAAEVTGRAGFIHRKQLANYEYGERSHADDEPDIGDIFKTGTQRDGCASRTGTAGDGLRSMESGSESGARSEEHTSELQSLRHLVC